MGSGKYGDALRVLAGGGRAANQVEYAAKHGASATPLFPTTGESPGVAAGATTQGWKGNDDNNDDNNDGTESRGPGGKRSSDDVARGQGE